MASIKITLSLLLFLAISTHSEAKLRHLRDTEIETKMTVYYKDVYGHGPDVNTSPMLDGPLNFTKFGAMFSTDDLITEDIEEGSPAIARGQGTYIITSLDGSHAQLVMSVRFISGKYNGSTLELQGPYAQIVPFMEVAVVGGTGKFRLARGYATYEVLSYDPASNYSVTRSNMTVLHYDSLHPTEHESHSS